MRKLMPLLLALFFPLAACGNDGPTDPTQAALGTYTLVQVNGSTLPALFAQVPDGRFDVMGGYLTLRSDMSYAEIINNRFTPTAGVLQLTPMSERGTFTVSGDTVQFQPVEGGPYFGTLSGNSLTYAAGRIALTFQKR